MTWFLVDEYRVSIQMSVVSASVVLRGWRLILMLVTPSILGS
jgi:hypothetical protein